VSAQGFSSWLRTGSSTSLHNPALFQTQKVGISCARFSDNEMRESNRSSSQDKVEYQRDHGENQQQVNQSAGHVKHSESAEPCNQQNDKQNCPDTHIVSSSQGLAMPRLRSFT